MNKNESIISDKIYKSIFIKSKEGTYCFNRLTYDKDLLNDIITKIEYDKIIENASKIMGNSLLKKKKNDKFEVSYWTIGLSSISLLLVVVYLFLIYYAQDSNYATEMINSTIIIVSISFIIIITSAFHNYFRKTRRYQTVGEIIKEDLDLYFININNTYYFSKTSQKYVFTGTLNFVYIPDKKIIECKVEKEQNQNNENENINEKNYNVLPELIVQKESLNDKVNNISCISKDDDQYEALPSDVIRFNNRPRHYRVQSVVSVGNKEIAFSPKEIEIELNKTNSFKN